MEFVAVDRSLLGGHLAVGRAVLVPIAGGAGDQMELYDGHRQAIDDALAILGHIEHPQHQAPHQLERLHQLAAAPVEAALGRLAGEQMAVVSEAAEQFGFQVPATALADEGHGQQLAIGALRRRAGTVKQRGDLLVEVIDDNIHPGAEVLEGLQHDWALGGGKRGGVSPVLLPIRGLFVHPRELA